MKTKSLICATAFLIGAQPALADVKTPADREALFEEIVTKTMAREAWSPIKNEKWGASFPDDFEQHRDDIINAETDVDLFYALARLSNARHDSHLSVRPVDGGLQLPDEPEMIAPIKAHTDFSEESFSLFIADLAEDLSDVENGDRIAFGDRIIEINGMSPFEYLDAVTPYFRASTQLGLRMRVGLYLHQKNHLLPPSLYGERLVLKLKPKRGRAYTVSAPYKSADAISFQGNGAKAYPGFEKIFDFESFDFYRATDDKNVVLFDWYGFRADIVSGMDATMEYAEREGLLDHDVIWDGSRSRGGGRGAYAIQRLQSKPFKTTFGNVRISDVIPLFVSDRKEQFDKRETMSDGSPELVGDPAWLIDWLLDDVTKGIEAGQAYSNDVPFKLAHAPKYSDGVLYPADQHFTGKMVCWLGPQGGSHLDQFAAIVADNDLCPILGMPAGGYSNTWEWEETLTWPGTDEPVVEYMWNIGHTIRPNGQILEGNPADIDEFIPITAENFSDYRGVLFKRTFEILNNERN